MPKTTKKITTIPATLTRFTATPINQQKKRRVAGYARVSTDHDDQFSSYAAQVDYYTNYIKGRDDWEFVEVYTDDGITGTTVNRPAFQRTMQMILCGEVNSLIVTELSRLSRNQSFANNLIEVTLPSFKVRLFSLSEGYDNVQRVFSPHDQPENQHGDPDESRSRYPDRLHPALWVSEGSGGQV